MGMARLLAKGWVALCIFAGAHSLRLALEDRESVLQAVQTVGVCTALFAAMGLLFVGGYAAATDHGPWLGRIKPRHFIPGFGDWVFAAFIVVSFANQVAIAPAHAQNGVARAVTAAIHFAIPGQRALEEAMSCGPDHGRAFAAAFAWLLAIVYLTSSLSRLRLTAGLISLERGKTAQALDPTALAFVLGVMAVVAIQALVIGTLFPYVPCWAFAEVPAAVLIGLAPLMLAYLIMAALANLLAMGPE